MAQRRILNYKAPTSSFLVNSQLVGVLEPGLYRGFVFQPTDNLTLTLNMSGGIVRTEIDLSQTAPCGLVMTRQGNIILEDAPILLAVPVGHPTLPRIDLVVCRHEHAQVTGGAAATYHVIPGTPSATPAAPALPNPAKEVPLGSLYMPAGAGRLDLPGVSYTRISPAKLGSTELVSLEQHTADLAGKSNVGHVHDDRYYTKTQLQTGGLAQVSYNNLTDVPATPNTFQAGMIMMWYGAAEDCPDGWVICDGTNGAPDLRGRFPVGAGSNPAFPTKNYNVGEVGGQNEVTLTLSQIPAHSHVHASQNTGQDFSVNSGNGSNFINNNGSPKIRTSTEGGGSSHENRPPFLALHFIMKL